MPSSQSNKPKILPAPPRREIAPYTPVPQPAPEVEDLLPMHHYLWLIRRSWRGIGAAVVGATALTALGCFLVKPVYESTARIMVDTKLPASVLSADNGSQSQTEVEEFINTELDLIQSDSVLRPVAEQYHLLPTLNRRELRAHAGGKAGSEAQGPVTLKSLSVSHPLNSLLIKIAYHSHNPQEAADVANAVARSYIEQTYATRAKSSLNVGQFMENQLDDLKSNMNRSAEALSAYERQLGVIDPERQTNVLAARVLQLNQEYTDAENERIRKQTAYRSVEAGNAAAVEVSTQSTDLVKLQQQLAEAEQRMALLKTTYGPAYPEYKKGANELAEITRQYNDARADIGKRIQTEYSQAASHEALLRDALAQAKAESDKLNQTSVEYSQLKRDAEANKTLYDELYRKIKEAGINAGFQSSAVRLAVEAQPAASPVFPKKGLFTALGFLLSLIGSIAAVILADMLDKSVRDPEQARRSLQIEVLGVLPDVEALKPAAKLLLLDSGEQLSLHRGPREPLIDWSRSQGAYTEAIRTMRSLVLLERTREPLRSLLVTSALAGEGKSTCTAHLAIAHALQGRKTLLIDADLRRPSQHGHFGLKNTEGLADVILEGRSLHDVRQPIQGMDNLHVVTAGQAFTKAAHLVGNRMPALLEDAVEDYDLVLLDAPPMLGLAEPIQLACAADATILIAQAGRTGQEAVSAALGTLHRLDVNVLGLVLNKVRREMSHTYEHYGVYEQYDEQHGDHALSAS